MVLTWDDQLQQEKIHASNHADIVLQLGPSCVLVLRVLDFQFDLLVYVPSREVMTTRVPVVSLSAVLHVRRHESPRSYCHPLAR